MPLPLLANGITRTLRVLTRHPKGLHAHLSLQAAHHHLLHAVPSVVRLDNRADRTAQHVTVHHLAAVSPPHLHLAAQSNSISNRLVYNTYDLKYRPGAHGLP